MAFLKSDNKNDNTPPTQPTTLHTTLHKLRHHPLLRTIFTTIPNSLTRPSTTTNPHKPSPTKSQRIERLRQEAEATFDLHDSMELWMRGDDAIFGFPSQKWKAMHPQMNYHLQRIRHREQHQLWGSGRLPACKEKDRATIAFLNSGGDAEETRCWPEGMEEEFLDELIWQWKSDTGI